MQCKNHNEKKKLLNSICEVNIDGKMALVSLYDDLPHFEYDLTIDNLQNSITKLKTFNQELKQHIKQLENENTHFKSVNVVLSKNITSLYKTASSEIQRKDKIIDDLRKSQLYSRPSTSKMFCSTNNYQIEKTEVNKLSENKKNTEQIKNTVEKTTVLNPNNNDAITTIIIKPNPEIPKTIYYKRMCQKLAQQNKTIESKQQMTQHKENTNTADKIIKDKKNEELNYDENILKEMTTSLIHNESKDINSTLVICESDITSSDCELDTTPVIKCDNEEKDKENVSVESFFSKLKQPAKSKKRLIITPATIDVQNKHPKAFKSIKKLNQINNLSSITQCVIKNSPEKQIIKSSNKDTQSICIKNNIPEYNPKTDNKPLTIESPSQQNSNQSTCNLDTLTCTNNITESNHLNNSTKRSSKNTPVETSPTNKTVTPSINIEVEQVPTTKKANVIKNDNNTQKKFNQVTQSSCLLNKDNTIKYNSKTDNKLPSTDKLHNQKLFTSEKNNQIQSLNIEVEQFPIRRRKTVIEKDTLALSNAKTPSRVTSINPSNKNELNKSSENVKNNNKESSSPAQQKNSQSTYNLDTLTCTNNIIESKQSKNSIKRSSKNTPVEKSPTRKTNVIKKDNNIQNQFKKVTQSSRVQDKNHKAKYDSKTDNKLLSIDKLHNQQLFTSEKNNQIKSTNIEVEQVPIKRKTEVLENDNNSSNTFNKFTQELCIRDHKNKNDSKMDEKQISTDIFCNQKSTCENKNQIPSVNIEVEQFPIKRRKRVIEKDNNSLALSNVIKRSRVTCTSLSNKNEFNKSTEYVKCLSVNNNKESSSPSQQNNSQFTCNLDTFKCVNNATESKHSKNSCISSFNNTPVETSPTNKVVLPSINIEVEQGFIFRQSNARKVIMHSKFDDKDDKQETKKGRRVQLITIEDHYSTPVPSFNGAKKTDIDVSNKSIVTEKIVESSSHFFVPLVKRRRTMNFGSSDS
ncbi:putative uncharacterized protein DDB_G0277255 [Rhopalosiphum padi]|uniref:putative uncharacterized protein DDB_G0277255 n=1 Tax=Rhopalosiphum padi TaxID=40932 RepID=UPI00298E31AB|nr:putative uncharacterized protein DDB_G0277255 [Rhopalosiphum padi]